MLIHLPTLSRLFYLSDLSTESYEAIWKDLRIFETCFSTHHGDCVKGWLIRLHFKNELDSAWSDKKHSLNHDVSNSYERLLSPTTLPAELIYINDTYTDSFRALLYQIGDYHLGSWWIINEDNSVTFFPFLKEKDYSVPESPPIYSYSSITLAELLNEIENLSSSNPGYSYFNSVSTETELDDLIASPSINPFALTGDKLKAVISYRLKKMSAYDWRNEYLILKKPDPHDNDNLRDLTVDMLRERIEFDNNILNSRANNPDLPRDDDDFNNPVTQWNIYNTQEKESHKKTFMEFTPRKTRET